MRTAFGDHMTVASLPRSIRDGLLQFHRNGRWGTCVDCPRDVDGKCYPEFCVNTARSDHQLKIDGLAKQISLDIPSA